MGYQYTLRVTPPNEREVYISFEAKDDQDALLNVKRMLDLQRRVQSVQVPLTLEVE